MTQEEAAVYEVKPPSAEELIQYPTPARMVKYDDQQWNEWYIGYDDIVLLLNHYIPRNKIHTEIESENDDTVYVRATITTFTEDGTIDREVSVVTGQANSNRRGTDHKAQSKVQSTAIKKAAQLLGIGADLHIIAGTKQQPSRQQNNRNQQPSRQQNNRNQQQQRPPQQRQQPAAPKGQAASSSPAPPGPANTQSSATAEQQQPALGTPVAEAKEKLNNFDQLGAKRGELIFLSSKLGMNKEQVRERVKQSANGTELEGLREEQLDYLIGVSRQRLEQQGQGVGA